MKNFLSKVGVAVTGFVASAAVFAMDTADIEAAQTSGLTAVELTVGGLIAIVAVVVGVGIVLSLMKKA